MDALIIIPLIKSLQGLPPEIISLMLLMVCITAMLLLFKLFGINGLYIYNTVAILSANIQVFKGIQLSFYLQPIALGTVVFATTYLCNSILNEHYGKQAAQNGVWLGFAAQLLMSTLMVITIGHKPLPTDVAATKGLGHLLLTEQAIFLLFTPTPRLLFASLTSFIIAQLTGTFIFQFLKNFTHHKQLWLRTLAATGTSALIDTFLFNFLAWRLLSPEPVSFYVLLHTYIIFTLITQLLVILLSAPIIYISNLCKPKLNNILTY